VLDFVRFDARFQRLFPCIPLLVHLFSNLPEAFLKSVLHFGQDFRDGFFCQSTNMPSDHDQDQRNPLSDLGRSLTSPSFRTAGIARVELQNRSVVPVAAPVGLVVYVEAEITGSRIYAKVFPVEVPVGVTAAVVVDGGVCGLQRSNCVTKINNKIDAMRQKSKLNQVRDVLYLRQCTPGRSREVS